MEIRKQAIAATWLLEVSTEECFICCTDHCSHVLYALFCFFSCEVSYPGVVWKHLWGMLESEYRKSMGEVQHACCVYLV